MKIVLISLCLSSLLYCDELQRIESIVKDIVKLRSDYEECQRSLGTGRNLRAQRLEKKVSDYKKLLMKEKQKNILLKSKLKNNDEIKEYKKTVLKQQKQIQALKKQIASLKKKLLNKHKVIKAKKQKQKIKLHKQHKKGNLKIEFFKASTFRLKQDSAIYDYPDGVEILKWEKDTTFTTNQKTENYIKITGFFENKKWKKAPKEMWVKSENVHKK